MAIFEQGAFQQNQYDTPDDIKRKRQMIRDAMMNYGSASNVGEGIGQLLNGIATGVQMRGLDRAEQAGMASGQAAQSKILDAMTGGARSEPSVEAPAASAPSAAAMPTSGGNTAYRDAIASIESKGSGDYSAVGPTHSKMGRALGRYQIMESNIPVWSKEILGRPVSADEFMANPQLQDAIFDGKFNSYVSKYGPEGAAQAWLGGPGGVGKLDRKDSLGTSIAEYGQRFTKALGGDARSGVAQALASGPAQVASLDPSAGLAYAAPQTQSGAAKVFNAIMPQTAPQATRGGSGMDVWRGRANQGTATDGTTLTRLPDGSIQRTNRFGVTERMSPEGGATQVASMAPQATPTQAAPMAAPTQAQAVQNTQQVAQIASQPSSQPSSGVDLKFMMEQAKNPWVDEQTRKMALDFIQNEQMKQTPEYRQKQQLADLQLEKERLTLEQLRNPSAKEPEAITALKLRANEAGLVKGTPEYNDFMANGGKPPAAPPKPSDIQEYEYAKNQGFPGSFVDFQLAQKKAGASQVNVGEGDKFYENLDKKNAEMFAAMSDTGMQAAGKIAQVDALENLLKTTPQGFIGAVKQLAGDYGITTEGLSDIQATSALLEKLVPAQRAPGSGTMSDADIQMFRRSLPRIINQPGGNAIILQTMRGIAQYEQQLGDIADRVANREITAAEGRKLIKQVKNPLSNIGKIGGEKAAPQAAQSAPETPPPQGVDADTWKHMTPEERALWK